MKNRIIKIGRWIKIVFCAIIDSWVACIDEENARKDYNNNISYYKQKQSELETRIRNIERKQNQW